MKDAAIISTTPAINTTTVLYGSTTEAYDAEGALKFTVTVVLVFGVGVIGLLGIYHFRGGEEGVAEREAEEADEFIKRFESRRYFIEKQERKKVMTQLIGSIITKTIEAQAQSRCISVRPSLRPTLSEPSLLQTQHLLDELQQDASPSTGTLDGQPNLKEKRKSVLPQDEQHPQLTSDQAMLVNDVFNLLEGTGGGGGGGGDSKHLNPSTYMGRSRAYSTSSPYSPIQRSEHVSKFKFSSLKAQLALGRKREEELESNKKHAGGRRHTVVVQGAQDTAGRRGHPGSSSSYQSNPEADNYGTPHDQNAQVADARAQNDTARLEQAESQDMRAVSCTVPIILVNDCPVTADDSEVTDNGSHADEINSCVTNMNGHVTGNNNQAIGKGDHVTGESDHATSLESSSLCSSVDDTAEREQLLKNEPALKKHAVFFFSDDHDSS